MNTIQKIEQEQLQKLGRKIPPFSAGDTLRVNVKVVEGNRERVQAYEGVCIARRNCGINSSFTVRKISYGEGVERVFPLHSPKIEISVVRRGSVRRAKLYYLRELTGKKARIPEKKRGLKSLERILSAEQKAEEARLKAELEAAEKAAEAARLAEEKAAAEAKAAEEKAAAEAKASEEATKAEAEKPAEGDKAE